MPHNRRGVTTDIHIEALTRERAPQACRMLAHAFVANPLNSVAFGPAQLARNEAFFRVGLAAMKGTKLVATDPRDAQRDAHMLCQKSWI